jgi:hypothetical protein
LTGHVYVTASGFGLRVIPNGVPYRFALGPDPTHLIVECSVRDIWLTARVMPHDGDFKSEIGAHTKSLADIADVIAGRADAIWWLETSVYRVPLPAGWTAVSAGDSPVFDLVTPDGSIVFIQTPQRLGAVADLHGPDQRVAATGADDSSEWVDLHYHHEGEEWLQRHHVRRVNGVNIVVTAQARPDSMLATMTTQKALIDTIVVPAGKGGNP